MGASVALVQILAYYLGSTEAAESLVLPAQYEEVKSQNAAGVDTTI